MDHLLSIVLISFLRLKDSAKTDIRKLLGLIIAKDILTHTVHFCVIYIDFVRSSFATVEKSFIKSIMKENVDFIYVNTFSGGQIWIF